MIKEQIKGKINQGIIQVVIKIRRTTVETEIKNKMNISMLKFFTLVFCIKYNNENLLEYSFFVS